VQSKRTVNMKTGGRRPTMNALVVVGNGNGAAGFAVGKASMMQEAVSRVWFMCFCFPPRRL
jgi:ribosomal protein S5